MNNPEDEPIIKDVEIKSVKWYLATRRLNEWKEYLLSVRATIDFDLWFSECEDWILPEGEYEYMDDDGVMHCWLDGFEMHWLVKEKGKVVHKVVDIESKIREIAQEKYHEHLYDLELENDKF